MVTTKRYAYGTCRNDSRYPQSWKRNSNGDPVKFFHFPGAVRQNKRRQRWITACHRGDSCVCTKDSCICSIHFVGGNGPTKEHPDPISAVARKEKVGLSVFPLMILWSANMIMWNPQLLLPGNCCGTWKENIIPLILTILLSTQLLLHYYQAAPG